MGFDLISAGANLVGGLLDYSAGQRQSRDARDMQTDFATQGVRWRVADANAAGIHPLFAMGAQLPTASPIQVGSTNFQGMANKIAEDLAYGVKMEETFGPDWRLLMQSDARLERDRQFKLKAHEVAKTEAEANIAQAEESMVQMQNRRMKAEFDAWKEGGMKAGVNADVFRYVPNEVTSPEPGTRWRGAGPGKPAWDMYYMDDDLPIYLPQGTSMSEALESLESGTLQAGVIAFNLRKFGPGWLKKFKGEADRRGFDIPVMP